ncbi:MAG: DUF2800 domain-containing protein [Ruminococcus sp.]|nr:DUF2800 domain-containing protein [Ruminococcus sp.]
MRRTLAVKHSTRSHARLSASSSARWMACPPSAMLNAEIPDVTTEYAKEGTCAHELAEFKVNKLLGIETANPTENLDYFDQEMEDCTDDYAQYIAEQICKYTDPVVMVEQRLDFSKYVPDGFGTGDCVIVADEVLTVIDYKHGKGVAVYAENNSQMMLYALGALELFDSLYDISEIKMVIFQPRLSNISEFNMTTAELLEWAENTLRPTAQLAAKGEGEFCAGEHCQFCKVKATCRKRAEYNLMLAQYDFAPSVTLEDTEIEAILEKADALAAWASDVKEYALSQALSGKQWTGYKVVEGRSTRKYTDEAKVVEAVKAFGKNPYGEPEILGITAMTKLLGGKKKFDEVLGKLTYKPQGKPTLVPVSDKRKSWNPATEDFKE